MSEETKERFASINAALPHMGDQITAAISHAAGEGVLIALFVVLSDGKVMSTTNMPEDMFKGFVQDIAVETAKPHFTVEEIEAPGETTH
jgi:hypothetical protein